MSDLEFFQTRMGATFYDGTMRELAASVKTIAAQLIVLNQTLAQLLERQAHTAGVEQPEFLGGVTVVGWTEGDGSGHEGYNVADYFDAAGRYRGPDAHGIEPLFRRNSLLP